MSQEKKGSSNSNGIIIGLIAVVGIIAATLPIIFTTLL